MFDGVVYAFSRVRNLSVQHIRTVGLIESKSSKMIADSPDVIIVSTDELGQSFVCAAEIETMTSLGTVYEATNTRENTDRSFCCQTSARAAHLTHYSGPWFHLPLTECSVCTMQLFWA